MSFYNVKIYFLYGRGQVWRLWALCSFVCFSFWNRIGHRSKVAFKCPVFQEKARMETKEGKQVWEEVDMKCRLNYSCADTR